MVQNFVKFIDNFEESTIEHFGLLLADGNIICLCCGGIVEPENYTIIEKYGTERIHYIDDLLNKHF